MLETIFAQSSVHKIGEKEVHIKQVSLEDIPLVVVIFNKVMDKQSKLSVAEKAKKLLSEDFNSVVFLFSKLTNLEEAEVKKLNLAASLKILTLVIQENKDFLLAHLPATVEALNQAMGGLSKSKN